MTASPATSPDNRDLRVAVLHNYGDERQPSMRLYADRLGEALLRAGVARDAAAAARDRPGRRGACARRPGRSSTRSSAASPSTRGSCARWTRTSSTSIDHGQAYLLNSLDPTRTVVTCHDVILLALAHGRIGSSPVPPFALQILHLSLGS